VDKRTEAYTTWVAHAGVYVCRSMPADTRRQELSTPAGLNLECSDVVC
jgi:hypothetical protein